MAALKSREGQKRVVQLFQLCFLCTTEVEERLRNGVVKQTMTVTQKLLDASGHSLPWKGQKISVPLLRSFAYSQNFVLPPLHRCRSLVGPVDN